jgi:hypothetical protein
MPRPGPATRALAWKASVLLLLPPHLPISQQPACGSAFRLCAAGPSTASFIAPAINERPRHRRHRGYNPRLCPPPLGEARSCVRGIAAARFVTRHTSGEIPDTPEALFRSLRPTDPNIRDLWLRQGDLLREYVEHAVDQPDVALELPTGAGKTLVGLLVAEFRRRARSERVAYLCPRVQLARQVAAKATGYGIETVTLVRRQADWPQAAFQRYSRGQAVAIATYHQVFNTHPRMDTSQTIVLDDAHSGEDPVASLWSLSVPRESQTYFSVLDAVIDALPTGFAAQLRDAGLDPYDRHEVDLVPPWAVRLARDHLRSAITQYEAENENARHAARMIRDEVGSCLVYVSWKEILLRPGIPPTYSHSPFAGANQRIYMSATFGTDGELERAFGVPSITRLRPRGSEDQDTGRRFFLMPGASHSEQAVNETIRQAISLAGRALVLAPSYAELDRFRATCVPDGVIEFARDDVEESFDRFVAEPSAVALLASHYDGMDLPDDACRLIVLTGFPLGTHLQERFIYETLGAHRALSETIRTRFVQGAGRCTRNAHDFAAVIIRGQGLVDFLSRDEEVGAMRPELQAEIRFGLDNSEDAEADVVGLLKAFWAQSEEWRSAAEYIEDMARSAARQEPTSPLREVAKLEVECWQAVWKDDLSRGIKLAQQVVDGLSGGEDLRPYRLFWLFLAGSWTRAHADETGDEEEKKLAATLEQEAQNCARTSSWFPQFGTGELPLPESRDRRSSHAAQVLRDWGIRGARFDKLVNEMTANLQGTSAVEITGGLTSLGPLLGFQALGDQKPAGPDAIWRSGDDLWYLFEAKTDEDAAKPISAQAVRQANTHQVWAERKLSWPTPKVSRTIVVVADEREMDDAARLVVGDLSIVTLSEIRTLAAKAAEAITDVRAKARSLGDDALETLIAETFRMRGLDESGLASVLVQRPSI